MRTASSRIDEYIEEEKTQTETKPTQFEAAANWLAIVPVWFWAIFGFIAALAVVFGLMVALNLGTPS